MKQNCILLLLLLLTATSPFAQPKKGSVILGGDLGVAYINYSNSHNNIGGDLFLLRVLPEFGYFTSDKVAMGMNLGVEYAKFSNYDTVFVSSFSYSYYAITLIEGKQKVIVLQPFISINHFFSDKIGIKNYFYAGAAFGSISQISDPRIADNSIFRYTVGYELKFLFFLKESMALNLGLVGLQYLNETLKYETTDVTFNTQYIQFNSPFKNSLSIGVEFYLNKSRADKK